MSRQTGSYISSRLVSSSQKREVMWNIIEPGDPYDIRKSMIAKLPGRKNFMGEHLQMVCLLQAAEIQRLCEYLQEYKLKFREIERRELDRHSYEIQIKQLSQQLSEDGSFKMENLKLKQFLRKQTAQFQDLKKRLAGFDTELGRKYEDSLRQIESLLQENQILKTNTNKMRVEFQQIINTKTLETEQLQRRLREASSARSSASEQKTQAYFKLEIQYKKVEFENKRIKEIIEAKNREIEELQGKSKQFIYQIQELSAQLNQHANLAHTLAEYQNRFALLGQELDRLNLVLREKASELNQATNKYRLSQQQNRRKTVYIQETERKKEIIEENYRQLESKLMQSMRNLSGLDQSKSLIKTYEFNLEKLSEEIERLNSVLRKKVQELDEANRRLSDYEYEVRKSESVKREVEDFRVKYGQFSKKIVDYEGKIALLSQEVQRLNTNLRRKNDQYTFSEQQLRNTQLELERYQKKLQDIDGQYRLEITRINQNFEISVSQLRQELQITRKQSSSPSKAEILLQKQYQMQIQSLNQLISNKNAEISKYQEELRTPKGDPRAFQQEKQRIIQHFQFQLNSLRAQEVQNGQVLGQYQRRLLSSAQEIQRLSYLLKKSTVTTSSQKADQAVLLLRKIAQYENKLAIMAQQIERLNQNLRARTNDNKNLQIKLKNYDLDVQLSRKREVQGYILSINELQRRNSGLVHQNQGLREELRITSDKIVRSSSQQKLTINASKEYEAKLRQLMEENSQLIRKASDFEYQITTFSNQIQRLNGILKQKVDQNWAMQQRLRNTSRQVQEFKRKSIEYEFKITTITKERQLQRQSYSRNSQFQLQNLKRQYAELESYNREYQIKVSQYQAQLRNVYQETDRTSGQIKDHQKKFNQYENKIVILNQEIERLNQILEKINQENTTYKKKVAQTDYLKSTIVTLEEKFSRSVQENDELRKGVSESNMTKTRLNQEYEYKIRTLTQENEHISRNFKEFQFKLTASSKQIQRLNGVLKSKIEEMNNLDSKFRSTYQQNQSQNRKIQELSNANRKIAQYDNKISILSQQIERLNGVLRIKIEEIGNYESRCRSYQTQLVSYQKKVADYENSINRELSTKISFLSKENQQLKLRLKQMTAQVNKIPQLQSKFNMVYSQLQRLNSNLKLKIQEITLLESKTRSYEQEIEKYRRRNEEIESTMHRELKNQSLVFQQRVTQLTEENDGLRRNLRELADTSRKIPDYQNRMTILSKEIQRLNDLLAKYSKETVPSLEEKLRNAAYQNQDLKRKFTEFGQLNKSYQQIVNKYKITTQENQQNFRRVQQYQHRMIQISNQVQRLNNIIRSKVEQLNSSQNKVRQAAGEIQILSKKLRQLSDSNRKIPQMQNHLTLLSQQIERLNVLLKSKLQECGSFESELRKFKFQYQNLQRRSKDYQVQIGEHKNARGLLEQKLAHLNNQNQDLRKGIRELTDSNRRIADYESRMALLSQEIQRLNMNLRMKIQELASADTMLKNYKREVDVKLSNLGSQLEEQKRRAMEALGAQNNKISEYQSKMLKLSQQIQRLNYLLKEHTYQIEVIHKKQPQYLAQIQRLNNTLRLKVEETTRWQQANNELKARLKTYQQNLQLAHQQYEKLKHSHSSLTEEHTRANKHLVQYEQSINKLYQQFERLQTMMQELKKENYEYKLKLQESGNLVEMNRALSAEIDRLTRILTTQNQDLQDLRLAIADQASLQKRINQDMALMVVLFAEIQSLRKRVKETEIQIETVRRSSLAPFKV